MDHGTPHWPPFLLRCPFPWSERDCDFLFSVSCVSPFFPHHPERGGILKCVSLNAPPLFSELWVTDTEKSRKRKKFSRTVQRLELLEFRSTTWQLTKTLETPVVLYEKQVLSRLLPPQQTLLHLIVTLSLQTGRWTPTTTLPLQMDCPKNKDLSSLVTLLPWS